MILLSPQGWPYDLVEAEDWLARAPDDVHLVELLEGVLYVVPRPFPKGEGAPAALLRALGRQLPEGLEAVPEIEVWLDGWPLTVRVPDLVVARTARLEEQTPHLRGPDVLLAAEVVYVGTQGTDRVNKMIEYAEAGIAEYWILEGDPLTLEAYALEAGKYRRTGTFSGVAELTACGVPVRIDLDRLTDPPVNVD